jgi:hypothetical protein
MWITKGKVVIRISQVRFLERRLAGVTEGMAVEGIWVVATHTC